MHTRDTLLWRTVGRVLLVSLALIALFNAVLGLAIHRQLHTQTDALLLQLARSEAHAAVVERSSPLHVHATVVALPSWGQRTITKHALVFDETCAVRASTPYLKHITQLPSALCHRPEGVSFAQGLSPEELRIATARVRWRDDTELRFLVAVDHAPIDVAAWQVIAGSVALSLLGFVLLTLLTISLLSPVARDLEHLTEACASLELGKTRDWAHVREDPFPVSGDAPRELRVLSETLGAMTRRTRATLRTHQRFVAEAAHELRTPLTAIRGELEVTLRRERSEEEYRETLGYLLDDVARLEHLGESLLQAARTGEDQLTFAPCALDEALDEALRAMEPRLREASLQIVRTGAPVEVCADRLALVRVLTNLIANTLDHAEATTLTLSVTQTTTDTTLLVCDDGRGVDAELVPHLFAPFQRGDRRRGHGLGLFIAQRLMHQQGGDLTYQPAATGGACWTLTLRTTCAAR